MAEIVAHISNGGFADEWDAEGEAGYPTLRELKQQHAGPGVKAMEDRVRTRLGPAVASTKRKDDREREA